MQIHCKAVVVQSEAARQWFHMERHCEAVVVQGKAAHVRGSAMNGSERAVSRQ